MSEHIQVSPSAQRLQQARSGRDWVGFWADRREEEARKERVIGWRKERAEKEAGGKPRHSLCVGQSEKARDPAPLFHRRGFKSCSGLTSSVNRALCPSLGLETLRLPRK